ncbi:hypothetical protein [Carboxylicivirga sp. RSCT41]|uniref:hypothetical protein n=1 Tax=Carboxylicivirga agarovorans TaxID=3417570 RepID=UPI003D3536B4
MTKNEMTTAMFEEIKEKLAQMNEKLDDVNYNHELAKSEIISTMEKQKDRSITIESVVNYFLKSISGIINSSKSDLFDEIVKILPAIEKQTSVSQTLHAEVMQSLKKRKQLIVKVIVFQILSTVSILFNVYLLNDNQRLKDSDIQLQYLKETNNVNEDAVSRLDTIFNVYRDEEAIARMKRDVKGE